MISFKAAEEVRCESESTAVGVVPWAESFRTDIRRRGLGPRRRFGRWSHRTFPSYAHVHLPILISYRSSGWRPGSIPDFTSFPSRLTSRPDTTYRFETGRARAGAPSPRSHTLHPTDPVRLPIPTRIHLHRLLDRHIPLVISDQTRSRHPLRTLPLLWSSRRRLHRPSWSLFTARHGQSHRPRILHLARSARRI